MAPTSNQSKNQPANQAATKQSNNAQPAAQTLAKAPKLPSVADGEFLTTAQGVRVNDDQNTLRAGERGPNFHQLPINQPHAPVNNYQQDSFMCCAIRPGKINYERNSQEGYAREALPEEGGFVSYAEPVSGT